MKLLSDVSLSESDVNSQLKVNQTLSKINTLMDEGDLLIVISGSGNSPNILKAIDAAKRNGSKVLGVLGFDGGKALPMCDVVFHVPSWDMQICEDIHLSFGHIVMKTICNEPIKNKKNRR